jgi:hypothetical protein
MSILAKAPIALLLALTAATAGAARDAPRAADAEILQIYDAVCVRDQGAPDGFQPVEWNAFPDALRLMNTYGHGGIFLHRDSGGRAIYIARTSGAGHDQMVASERRCGVAIRGANFGRLVTAFGQQLRVNPISMRMVGHQVAMFQSPQGVLSVSEAEEGWIIVRAFNMSFR